MIAALRLLRVGPVSRTARSSRSRGRRAVVSFFVAYLVGTAGFGEALSAAKPSWWDADSVWRQRRLRDTARAGPAVAVFGSSRSQMGLSPLHVLDGMRVPGTTAFNLSAPGAGPYRHLIELRRALDAGVRPQAVLVEILPLHLSRDGRAHADTLLDDTPSKLSRADVQALAPYFRDAPRAYETWTFARLFVWGDARRALAIRFAPWLLTELQLRTGRLGVRSETGWVPFDSPNMSPTERRDRFAVAEREYRRDLGAFEFDPHAGRVYADLVARCRERGVAVAFYLMPESPRFRAFTPPETRRAIRSFLARLADENDVPIFDATEWGDDERAFADGHHLLEHGAKPFGARFGRECVAPWLASLAAVVP